MNLSQGSITAQDYEFKLIQLSRNSPHIVADSRAKMNKFLYSVLDLKKIEYRNAMVLENMKTYSLLTHAQ